MASQLIEENEDAVNGSMYTKTISEGNMDGVASSNHDIPSSHQSKSRHNMSARPDDDAGITNPAPMPQMESESGNASPEMSRTIDLEDKM